MSFDLDATPTNDSNFPGRPTPGELYRKLPNGKWAFWFDSSSIKNFDACPQLFKYRVIDNLRPKGPERIVPNIGRWWATLMEELYSLMAVEKHVDQMGMIQLCASAWVRHQMDDFAFGDKKNEEKFHKFAKPTDINEVANNTGIPVDVLRAIFVRVNPDESFYNTVPVGPLMMALKYYLNYYEQDRKNWQIIAAEQGFGLKSEVPLGEGPTTQVYYVGKPDLVILEKASGILLPVDHKAPERIEWNIQDKWKPHPQTAGYIYSVGLLARSLGYSTTTDRCIINAAARQEPAIPRDKSRQPGPRFTRVMPTYSPSELEEWRSQVIEKAERLRWCIENDKWAWNESQCHMWAGCEYRRIDNKPPEVRQLVKDTDFVKVDPWIPYEVEDSEGDQE